MTPDDSERKRAVEIGKEGNTASLTEVVSLLSHPAASVRRAAASAARKLMAISGDLRREFCISLDWRDLENIESVIEEKLSRYIRL